MRLFAVACAVAIGLSGCLTASNPIEPQGIPGAGAATAALGPVVHRAGQLLPASASEVLGGAAPRLVEKMLNVSGAEPNLGITSSGAMFVSTFDLVMRSTDLGDTWTPVYEFGEVHGPPPAGDPVRNSDPMLWVDAVTDRVFNFPMFPILLCSQGMWSDDDGATWTGRPLDCGLPGVDHQKVASGPYHEGTTIPRLGDYPNAVYYCYNNVRDATNGATNCAVSTDGGMTFVVDNQVDQGCGGLNGHPAAALDGTVYVPYGANCHDTYVARSRDNGMSWDAIRLHTGGLGGTEDDNDIGVTPDGTAYYVFSSGADHRTYLMRTHDGFDTAEGPFMVSPPDVTSTRFGVVAAGSDGRIAVAYLGTRDSAAAPNDALDSARWHLFLTVSLDADAAQPTFVTTQVTPPEDPVQIGYMWESGGGDPARNLLDFIDVALDSQGRAHVAFADGCVADCAGNATATKQESRARAAAVAVQVEGPLLWLADGAPAPVAGYRWIAQPRLLPG